LATRRGIFLIAAFAVCLPACAVLETLGLSEPQAPPPKVEGRAQTATPATAQAPAPQAAPMAAAPSQAAEGKVLEPEPAPSSTGEEAVPGPPPPTGSKEGAPASSSAPKAGPAGGPVSQQGKPQYISLNFDNADLELVLRSIADITGINFIIGPGVKTNVTMRTTTKVPASEAFSILELVLEVNNLVAVKEGLFYKIVPMAVAQQEPQDVQVGKERSEERERYVTQIVHLDHLSAEEMARILQSFLSKGARMVVHKETNSMIIAGFSSTVKRLLDTIKALDVPSKRDNIQRIFVYFVENVQATQLANILNTLYGRRDLLGRAPTPGARPGQPPVRPGAPPTSPAPPPLTPPGQPPPPGAPQPPGAEAAPGEVVGEVTIVPDEGTNALIIKTSPRNYEFIEATIKKLDIVPKQVVIELLLAQINLKDNFNFSLEEIIRSGQFLVAGAFGGPIGTAVAGAVQSAAAPKGLTFAFVDKDKFRVVLNNLASVSRAEVLANPHLLTANNKEAKIQIGSEVPIVTNEQSSLTSVTSGQSGVFRTLQQKDIGIIMGIKPHVNEKRLVTLEIEVENIALDSAAFGNTDSPSFLKTTAKTSVVVEDGQTLLIGGLIRTDKSKGYSGIPFLSQIPLIGYLFRNTAESLEKNELVILITPHVIASPEEGRAFTEQFKGQVETLEPILKRKPELPTRQP
jgi:type II secretory pathway component GspD/PulD (secretin)